MNVVAAPYGAFAYPQPDAGTAHSIVATAGAPLPFRLFEGILVDTALCRRARK
jgi:hypothetical protein